MPLVTAPLPDLVLYARAGCHLCDDARDLIAAVLAERRGQDLPTPALREVDITSDPAAERAYFDRVPVVELGGRRLELVVSAGKLRRLVADALG